MVVAAYSEEYFTEPDAYIDDTNAIVVNVSIIKQLPTAAQVITSLVINNFTTFIIIIDLDHQLINRERVVIKFKQLRKFIFIYFMN